MENQAVYEVEKRVSPLGDDALLRIAETAEKRIDAVIKIKQVALKVTNERDWVNQDGNPYLMASGSEKIGNLFDISWSFLEPEPQRIQHDNGHYTYTYRARFSLGGRDIDAEGSRSSKDGFFRQYANGKEKAIEDRDNERDVKMAAYTNLLGNGITRILGIRNLTWEDLKKFANIDRDKVKGFEYKKKDGGKPPITEPNKVGNGAIPDPEKKITENQGKRFYAIASGAKKSKEEIEAFLKEKINSVHTGDIPMSRYDELCAAVVTWSPQADLWDEGQREPGQDG